MNSGGRDREQDRDVHLRLLADDPAAPSDLALAHLDPLGDWLREHNSRIDPHLCATAAEDAILALIKNPRSYDPARLPLDAYLHMSASGDLKNLLRRERRHTDRATSLERVELSVLAGNTPQEDDPAAIVERAENGASERQALPSIPDVVLRELTDVDRQILALMLRKERRTARYAELLQITERPIKQQREEVKRVKDRIKKRVERAGGRL